MVRLLTHNLLACHAKSCISSATNFPLLFQDASVEIREAEFNPDFVRGFLPKVEWTALVGAARQVSLIRYAVMHQTSDSWIVKLGDTSLPDEQPEMVDDETIQKLHHVLLEVRFSRRHIYLIHSHPFCLRDLPLLQMHVEEGAMVCQSCKHVYPISNGIPNMVRAFPLPRTFCTGSDICAHAQLLAEHEIA